MAAPIAKILIIRQAFYGGGGDKKLSAVSRNLSPFAAVGVG